ncbi:MAG TPA: diacylglycerol kinase family lipid kinase [Candidatus Scybalocola faecavium]|nr:diacylglycerol kinase family lipid kinase [Candidatus Scybalocola faecavium]
MKKALFILNPSSGSQDFWKDVEAVIGCLVLNEIINHADVVYTEKKYDAREAARGLRRGQYDVVVAVGGDGTVSDVINGIIKGKSGIPVAVLPCGTSNAFAQALDLPFGKEDFCCMLRDFRIMDIDVGRINGEYFVGTLAGGIAGEISARAASTTKAILGKKAYFFEALRAFPKQFFQSMKLYFDSEEFTAKTDTMMFYISNAGGIAGNKRLFKNSTMNDGVLNAAVFEKTSPIKFAMDFSRFLRGKNMDRSKVRCFSTKKIKIKSLAGSGIFLAWDGDVAGSLPVEVECVSKAARIVVPNKAF